MSPRKLKKPHRDFPLFPHGNGQWAKKVRGRFHYFGKVARDPHGKAALQRWVDQKDELLAGRTPRKGGDELILRDLVNRFLTYKKRLQESGDLSPRTFERYHKTCEYLIKELGSRCLVADLHAENFRVLRSRLAKKFGPVALANEIQIVRSVFGFAFKSDLIVAPVHFGPGFQKPSAKTVRQSRNVHGPRMFTQEQVRLVLGQAGTNLGAMILLGLNGALGNTELGELPTDCVDLTGGWLDYPRTKTAIHRRIPLWPETVAALREVMRTRPPPKNSSDAGLLFIGRRGLSYVGKHRGYRVTAEMSRALAAAGIEGRAFYDLRRTFQTLAEGAGDLVAVQSIMGHAPRSDDMSAVYRQVISDERLRKVVEHVRAWLFGSEAGTATK